MPHLLDNYGNKENRHWYTYLHRLHHSHLHHSYRRVRNASTSTFSVPETTVDIIGGWNNYNWIYDETLNGADYWTYKLDVANAFRIHFYYNNADGSRWVDGDDDPANILQNGDTITMNIDGNSVAEEPIFSRSSDTQIYC